MSTESCTQEEQAAPGQSDAAASVLPAEGAGARGSTSSEADYGGTPARDSESPAQADPAELDNGSDGAGEQASEPEKRPGVWSQQTITARAKDQPLITDESGKSAFDHDRLDPASYRLSIGSEVYISPAKERERASVTSLQPMEGFYIPPGQFAFLITDEVVKVPPDAFAFIAMRTKVKFKGLVNVSGFHADPGYDGRLIFAVFNAGPGDVHLRQGDELFTISFASLDERTIAPRIDKERVLHISSDIITPIAGQVQSFAGLKESIDEVEEDLDDRLRSLEREIGIFRWALPLAVSLVVALLVRLLSSH